MALSRDGAAPRAAAALLLLLCAQWPPRAAGREFLYFPQSDVMSVAETIFPQSSARGVTALSAACDATPSCIGFNQDGWLKNGSVSLAPYPTDLWLLASTPAPPPPPPLWPMPRALTVGAAPLVVSSALAFRTAGAPPPELAAAFARFSALIFSHGASAGAAAARAAARARGGAGAAVLAALDVDVADPPASLDLGVNESYTLTLPSDGSPGCLSAATVWGALQGLQTLSQLVRFDFDAGAYHVPSGAPVAISDAPAFAWRGLMVDPARQFLPVATLRALVDSMTMAKLNTLHVHLLDCDSFPLEVRAPFDRLWQGAFSARERYTAGDLAAFVEFARLRGVRVVFEFDQPGHMGAMCKAYPSLCPSPACGGAYGADVLDPSSNDTLPAMQAVVDALVAAQVDSVLHLGGDEVSDACWLASPSVRAWMAAQNISSGDGIYRFFVQQSNAMALAAGKAPMRWEEVYKHFGTQLDQRTIIHAWLSSDTLVNATNHGYRAVFSVNAESYYLDYLGVQWHDVFAADPLAGVTNASARALVLGGQVCAWGETMDAASVLSVVWPRAAAAAEKLWSYAGSSARDFSVVNRLAQFRCDLLERGVPAPLPGALNAGDMRPAWTVGSCGGGFSKLC